MTRMDNLREPYVGTGVDGALRSARIDESEADMLERSDPRRAQVLDSARRWREQAAYLESEENSIAAASGVQGNSIRQAALRYDNDPEFRAKVDGRIDVDLDDFSDVDWAAAEAARDAFPS